MSNLTLLCVFHHQLVLEHGYAVVTTAQAGIFRVSRPDGTTIEPAPSSSGDEDLATLDGRLHHAPAITDETTPPEWCATEPQLAFPRKRG